MSKTLKRVRPGAYVGFRTSLAMKAKLDDAARASNRSLSTEVQFRLEKSFASDAEDKRLARIERRIMKRLAFQ